MAESKPAESKPKAKIKKEAVEMRKQEPKVRAKNFNEVALGYSEAEAYRRSKPLSAVRKASVCHRLSSGCSNSRIH